MNTILVTGACGFIGRATALALHDRGISTVGLDLHPKDIPYVTRIQRCNLANRNDRAAHLWQEIAESDGVIHLAGILGTSELLASVGEAIEVNVAAAADVMDGCRTYNKPLVIIATGNNTWTSVYPATKECAVRLAQCYAQDRGLRVAVVRAMNVYGPWQKAAPVRKYIPNLIRWAMRNEPAEIYGDGEQFMDAIWVGDVAEILVRALIAASRGQVPHPLHIFEAGTGWCLTANRVADMIWKEVRGTDVAPKVYLPMRAGEPKHSVTVADFQTLASLWPDRHPFFLPLMSFEEGLIRTVKWYQENPEILKL